MMIRCNGPNRLEITDQTQDVVEKSVLGEPPPPPEAEVRKPVLNGSGWKGGGDRGEIRPGESNGLFLFLTITTHHGHVGAFTQRETRSAAPHTGRCVRILSWPTAATPVEESPCCKLTRLSR